MDRMAGHLRQLESLCLFSAAEIKSIVKKRTDHEYVMQRRQLTPEDFYSYLQYEINLDKLRAIRCDKLEKSGGSDKQRQDALRNIKAACSRHICSVFDRATRRFPNNMELWTDYIAYLKDSKSSSILNTIFGKALALHPKNIDFWLQAAVHEIDENNNVHAARTLLQRALRVNKQNKKLWVRYFELELWNASRIAERGTILGVEENNPDLLLAGAPSVVFKHALMALPDLDMACEMHRSSQTIQDGLAALLEAQMREKFSHLASFWSYLTERAAAAPPKSLDVGAAATKKKRKRGQEDEEAEDEGEELESIASRFSIVLALLDEGRKAIAGSGTKEAAAEDEAFCLLELSRIEGCLEAMFAAANGEKAQNEDSSATGKGKGKVKAKGNGGKAKSKSDGGLESCVAALGNAAKILELRILGPAGTTTTNSSSSSTAPTAAQQKKMLEAMLARGGVGGMPLFFSACVASNLVSRLVATISQQQPSIKIPAALGRIAKTDEGLLVDVLSSATLVLTKAKLSTCAFGGAAWNQGVEAVKSWSRVVLYCHDVCSARSQGDDTLVRALVTAGSTGAAWAVCCEEGCAVLEFTLAAMEKIAASEKALFGLWKTIISSTHFDPRTRGDWCAKFAAWSLSRTQGGEQSKTVTQIWQRVEGILSESAPALVGGDLEAFYSSLLQVQLDELNRRGTKQAPAEIITLARSLSEKAVAVCPSVPHFWDSWISLERSLDCHQAANHIEWRRNKGSSA